MPEDRLAADTDLMRVKEDYITSLRLLDPCSQNAFIKIVFQTSVSLLHDWKYLCISTRQALIHIVYWVWKPDFYNCNLSINTPQSILNLFSAVYLNKTLTEIFNKLLPLHFHGEVVCFFPCPPLHKH